MNPQTIKAKLVKQGIRQADIARSIKVSRQSVHKVICGKRRSQKIESAVSAALGKPQSRVFPKDLKK